LFGFVFLLKEEESLGFVSSSSFGLGSAVCSCFCVCFGLLAGCGGLYKSKAAIFWIYLLIKRLFQYANGLISSQSA